MLHALWTTVTPGLLPSCAADNDVCRQPVRPVLQGCKPLLFLISSWHYLSIAQQVLNCGISALLAWHLWHTAAAIPCLDHAANVLLFLTALVVGLCTAVLTCFIPPV